MKRKWIKWIVIAGLTVSILFAGVMLINWWNEGRFIQEEAEAIAQDFCSDASTLKAQVEKNPEMEIVNVKKGEEAETGTETVKWQLDYDKLKETNADAIGWIRIEGTNINHPVVQSFDNMKYMDLNIYGEPSRAGTPFLDCTNNLKPLDSNLVIYGHNMGVGRTSAFSTLTKYKHWLQWKMHPLIELNLQGEISVWRIFAVIQFNIDDLADYNYTTHNFLTAEEKTAFAEEAKQRSIYDTGINVEEDDYILTLSTCDRSEYGRNGRIIIMAVKS